MKAPRLFLGMVLLYWGWQYDYLIVGVCLGLVLEILNFYEFRLNFKSADFNRFVDVSIIFLAGTIIIALSTEAKKAIYILVQWLPVISFPIILSQQLSLAREIDMRAFFLVGRKKMRRQVTDEQRKVDVSYIYALLCILSAGMTKDNAAVFFAVSSFFFLWALFNIRPSRFHAALWGISVLCILSSAYFSYKGMQYTRRKISRMIMGYYMDYYNSNPFKNSLAIGDIGELKLSDRIILRVSLDEEYPGQPVLLQNATYDSYAMSKWYSRSAFTRIALDVESDIDIWQIQPPVDHTRKMTIYSRQSRGKAVLYLPQGTVSISEMDVRVCEKNAMQAVRVEGGSSFVKSVAGYTGKLSYDPEPEERDFYIGKSDEKTILNIVDALGLKNKPPEQVLSILKKYFSGEFQYSLELKGRGEYATPIQNFLLHTKSGHCELFATSAALILRGAGIPARYATGFIVHEYSRFENRFLVRQRDAHAWLKIYINGTWKNYDTTPAISLQTDMANSNPSAFIDLLSFVGFKLSQFRYEAGEKLMKKYGLWLILPLVIMLFYRLKNTGAVKRAKKAGIQDDNSSDDVYEAAFYTIEKQMAKKGHEKYPAETYASWFLRVADSLEDPDLRYRFLSVIAYYHKWRFSRYGLGEAEQKQFESDVDFVIGKIVHLP